MVSQWMLPGVPRCSVSYQPLAPRSSEGTTGETIHAAILFSSLTQVLRFPLTSSCPRRPLHQILLCIYFLFSFSLFFRRNEPKTTKILTTKCLNVSFFFGRIFHEYLGTDLFEYAGTLWLCAKIRDQIFKKELMQIAFCMSAKVCRRR